MESRRRNGNIVEFITFYSYIKKSPTRRYIQDEISVKGEIGKYSVITIRFAGVFAALTVFHSDQKIIRLVVHPRASIVAFLRQTIRAKCAKLIIPHLTPRVVEAIWKTTQ